jgi:nitroreductase
MDTIKAIHTRRSIRKYTKEIIPDEVIQSFIKCGMYAPSAGNEQPWHFVIIKNPDTLKEIPTYHSHAQMLTEAYLAILICFDPTLEKHKSMAIQDCAAATQNILLAIHDHGYGGVWLGIYPREKRMNGLRSLLHLPEEIIPFSLIAVGRPNESKQTPDRLKKDRIHYEQW